MVLNDALAVIGVFLLGAAAGGCLKYARYRGLVALCNQLLAETKSLRAGDGMRHFGQSPAGEGSTSRIARLELPVSSGAESSSNEIADFKLQRDDLGAPPRASAVDNAAWRLPAAARRGH